MKSATAVILLLQIVASVVNVEAHIRGAQDDIRKLDGHLSHDAYEGDYEGDYESFGKSKKKSEKIYKKEKKEKKEKLYDAKTTKKDKLKKSEDYTKAPKEKSYKKGSEKVAKDYSRVFMSQSCSFPEEPSLMDGSPSKDMTLEEKSTADLRVKRI